MDIIRPIKQGIITLQFGAKENTIPPSNHTGIDIGVNGNPINVPVYCAKSGKITWIDENPNTSGGFGKVIYIQLPDGWYSIYAHFNLINYDLKINDNVNVNDFLGIMGTTGNSTGKHLHYQERITMGFGTSRNPIDISDLYK